jgi:hypothetical protein
MLDEGEVVLIFIRGHVVSFNKHLKEIQREFTIDKKGAGVVVVLLKIRPIKKTIENEIVNLLFYKKIIL